MQNRDEWRRACRPSRVADACDSAGGSFRTRRWCGLRTNRRRGRGRRLVMSARRMTDEGRRHPWRVHEARKSATDIDVPGDPAGRTFSCSSRAANGHAAVTTAACFLTRRWRRFCARSCDNSVAVPMPPGHRHPCWQTGRERPRGSGLGRALGPPGGVAQGLSADLDFNSRRQTAPPDVSGGRSA